MGDEGGGTLSIGDVSDRTGVSVRALRHYEQQGLILAVRTNSGHRRFHPEAVDAVARIRMFLDAGLPLSVVAQVMPCFVDEGAQLHACVAKYLEDHMVTIKGRIDALDGQRGALERLQELVVS